MRVERIDDSIEFLDDAPIENIEGAIEKVLEDSNLSTSGEKVKDLNDRGRNALNSVGATIRTASMALVELLDSGDEKTRLNAAKFIFERHSGRLDNTKEANEGGVVINILGGQQVITPGQPSLFNPSPVRKDISNGENSV